MKALITISSCQSFEDSGLNEGLRKTWLPDAVKFGFDYKFFHGKGSTPKDDVIVVDVDDGMGGLTEKAKAKAKWAVDNGYDYTFSCFPDTYACPERFKDTYFWQNDYTGNVYQHPGGAPYCQGGPGYFLSRRACEELYTDVTSYLNDDCWVGDILHLECINPVHHAGFTNYGPGPLKTNYAITNHLSTQPGGFTVEGMLAEHQRWLDSNDN